MRRIFVKVEGIVQGVGFRPFVYKLAHSLNLRGWVNNNSEGVYIDVQGKEKVLEKFLHKLKNNSPVLSRIENIAVEEKDVTCFSDFVIKHSEKKNEKVTLISADIATCEECIEDITDPLNKRYGYAFTNCTSCGPRFSIIEATPYDRNKTTMKKFELCSDCQKEYTNPKDRRFHAQPNACAKCGPHIWAEDTEGKVEMSKDIMQFIHEKLKEGKIFAIKGLGGFHIVCNGANEEAIEILRSRKNRIHKPFAVMMRDVEITKKHCIVNVAEEKILTGNRKPITILHQCDGYSLPENIAPNQNTLGVMLPYTPLYQLLFSKDIEVLVMTSANVYGLPIEYTNEGAREKLKGIVDYFLFHNRDIHIPVDDSVVKVVAGESRMIRRARGYAPEPINMNCIDGILACGSNMKNTFCISKENFLFLSQHNGDLENLETCEHYENNIKHFKNIFKFTPKYLACDMHPVYASTEYAHSMDLPKVYIQHHHAHIVSCLAENKVKNKVIGVAYDGTGYGTDEKIWGGEFLICDYEDFKRVGHLEYIKMPGGEKAIKEPFRMAISYINKAFEKNDIPLMSKLFGEKVQDIFEVLKANINCPETSSMGRLFDAAASIIGIRNIISYEGQASIEMEATIEEGSEDKYTYNIKKAKNNIIEVKETIKALLTDRINGVSKGRMAAKFHNTVVSFTCDMCTFIREKSNIDEVALSGGVFQNSYLLRKLVDALHKEGFVVHTHKNIPCNDGGISLGQIIIADALIKNKESI